LPETQIQWRRRPAQPHPNRPDRSVVVVTPKPRSRRAYFRSQTVEFPVRIAHLPCSQWVTSSVFKGAFLAVRKRSLLHLGVHTLEEAPTTMTNTLSEAPAICIGRLPVQGLRPLGNL
jgi:hypothetical protein